MSAEEAAEAFREVVAAFEVLSDTERREYYDATGRTKPEEEQASPYGHEQYHWHFHWHYQQHANYHHASHHLRDTWEAQQAQSRLMHIVSLDQFRMVMLDEDGLLERHFILCFVKPGPMEAMALDEMVFPYPFAGMSEHEIWWEDILQTMYVSLTRHEATLTEFFGITSADLKRNQPIFVYGKAGFPLDDGTTLPRIQTTNRDEMERFVWEHLEVEIEFVNQHDHPVELFWLNGKFGSIWYDDIHYG